MLPEVLFYIFVTGGLVLIYRKLKEPLDPEPSHDVGDA
jgi:hypothetical protein